MDRIIINKKEYYGFTLVELIITSALISIILGLIVSILINNTKLFVKAEINSQVQNEGRTIENFLINEVKYASNITLMEFDDLQKGTAENYYIYLNSNDNGIYYVEKGDDFDKNEVSKYGVFMGSLSDMDYELEFSLIDKADTTVDNDYDKTAFNYKINVFYKDDSFGVDSVINISNTTDKGYTNVVVPINKDFVTGDAIAFDFDNKVTGLGSYILYDKDNLSDSGNVIGKNKKKLAKDVLGRFSGNNIDLWIEFDQEYEVSVQEKNSQSELFKDLYPSFDFVGEVIDVRWPSGKMYDYTDSSFKPVEYDVKGSDGFINTYYVRAYRVDRYNYEKIQNDCGIIEYSFLKSKNSNLEFDYVVELDEELQPVGANEDGNNVYEITIEGTGGLPVRPKNGLGDEFILVPKIEFVGTIVRYKQPGDEEYSLYSETDSIDLMKSTVKDHYPDKPTEYVVQSLDGQVTKIYNVFYKVHESVLQDNNGYIEETGPIFYKLIIEQPESNKIVDINSDVSLLNSIVYATSNNEIKARPVQGYHIVSNNNTTFEIMLIMKAMEESEMKSGFTSLEYTPPIDFLILQDGSTSGVNLVQREKMATRGLTDSKSVSVSGSGSGDGILFNMANAKSSLGFATTSRIETNLHHSKISQDQGMIGVMLSPSNANLPSWNRLALYTAYTAPKNYVGVNRFPKMRTAYSAFNSNGSMTAGWTWTPSGYDATLGGSSTAFSNVAESRTVYFSIYFTESYYLVTYHYTSQGDQVLKGTPYTLIDSFKIDLPRETSGYYWKGQGYDLYYIYRGMRAVGSSTNASTFKTLSNYFYHN